MSRTLNVIEMSDRNNISVDTFIFREESVRMDQINKRKVARAEKLFIEKGMENGMKESDHSYCLDEGYFEMNDYKLFLVWSN